MKIDIIAGARPNFIKVASIIDAINRKSEGRIKYRLIHTGQHYDAKMSGNFFDQLGIPKPDINLQVGSGTQAEQTAGIMLKYERVLLENKCDYCLVVGDVTSTLATSVVAKKMGAKVIHVEAGIRSGDISMPEEVNRIVTDSITDLFFTTTIEASENLLKSGVVRNAIHFVGNTMIDTLLKNMDRLRKPMLWDEIGLVEKDFFLLTLHRPSNVDSHSDLKAILTAIVNCSMGRPVIFPVHPRTLKSIEVLDHSFNNIHFVEPLDYLEFIYLLKKTMAVITDSGGITEEATVLGVPCMTLRDSTERPETCTVGTNVLLGTNPQALEPAFKRLFENQWPKGKIPALWDGHTGDRIVDVLSGLLKTF